MPLRNSEAQAGTTTSAARASYTSAVLQARRGRYEEAERLLREALDAGGCTPVEALDLHARVCAQQGRFLEAEALWRQALKLEPANPRYEAALVRIRQLRRPSTRLTRILAAATALCLLLGLVWLVVFESPAIAARESAATASREGLRQAVVAAQRQAAESDDELAVALERLTAGMTAMDRRQAAQLSAASQQLTASMAAMDKRQAAQLADVLTAAEAVRYHGELLAAVDRRAEDVGKRLDAVGRHGSETARDVAELKAQLETVRQSVADVAARADTLHNTQLGLRKALSAAVTTVTGEIASSGRRCALVTEQSLAHSSRAVEAAVQEAVKTLPTAAVVADLAAAQQEIRRLLADITLAVQEVREAQKASVVSTKGTSLENATQPAGASRVVGGEHSNPDSAREVMNNEPPTQN